MIVAASRSATLGGRGRTLRAALAEVVVRRYVARHAAAVDCGGLSVLEGTRRGRRGESGQPNRRRQAAPAAACCFVGDGDRGWSSSLLRREPRAAHFSSESSGGQAPPAAPPSQLDEGKFHAVADATLHDLMDAVEAALEGGYDGDFDVNLSQGVLTIAIEGRGSWVLNKQTPNRQIWWSSPFSGPKRYELDLQEHESWINTRDRGSLVQILKQEMADHVGIEID